MEQLLQAMLCEVCAWTQKAIPSQAQGERFEAYLAQPPPDRIQVCASMAWTRRQV